MPWFPAPPCSRELRDAGRVTPFLWASAFLPTKELSWVPQKIKEVAICRCLEQRA